MSLNLNKLEKVRDWADGKQARCPACAEAGQDGKGEHLRIYADGRFGCCVHPRDSEHRKRIYALVGERSSRRGIVVRVASKTIGSVQNGILGRLGRVFPTPKNSDASDGVIEVEPLETEVRTPRTGVCESSQETAEFQRTSFELSRTARTPSSLLTRIEKRIEIEKEKEEEIYVKESREGVRAVRSSESETNPPIERLPYFTPDGTLVIPFSSPQKYHWWNGGQSVSATLMDIKKGLIHADDF